MAWVPDQTPIVSLSWEQYVAAGGALIPEDDWPRYLAEAERVLADVTFDRIDDVTDTDVIAKIEDATFRVADAIYQGSQGIASEKLGGYSVSYKGSVHSPEDVAIKALRGTGLTYAGLSVAASGEMDDTIWG